jgi:phosphatidylglycerol:prolipoprotein diacylglycerol transferase
MDPVAFSIGPISVRWYGLMYVVGIAIGLLVAWPYARSKGITTSQLEKFIIWAILAGFVGARLYYVIQQPLNRTLPSRGASWRCGKAVWLFMEPSSP